MGWVGKPPMDRAHWWKWRGSRKSDNQGTPGYCETILRMGLLKVLAPGN